MMLNLLRAMKGFGYGLLISPLLVAVVAFVGTMRTNAFLDATREARADIENAHIYRTKTGTTSDQGTAKYTLDLTWRDAAGKERRAAEVPIPSGLGDKLIDGQQLRQNYVHIRYRSDEPDRVLAIERSENANRSRSAIEAALTTASSLWPLAIIGALMFYLSLKWAKRRRDQTAGSPTTTD